MNPKPSPLAGPPSKRQQMEALDICGTVNCPADVFFLAFEKVSENTLQEHGTCVSNDIVYLNLLSSFFT